MPRVRFLIPFSPLLLFTFSLLLLSACAAPNPTPPPASEIALSPSPFPVFTPSQTSAPTPATSLHAPDPATLIRVLNYGIGLERDAWNQFDYPTFHGDFLTSPEARGLFDFVQADLERSYPDGLPNAETLFSDGTLDPNIWFPPRAVWLLAQTAVVNLLRESQSTLTENTPLLLFSPSSSLLFSLTPTSHELDGDTTPEWLVEVISESYNLHGWIPLDETADGYTLIPNVIQHENLARGESTTFQFTPDLNGDGLDDLVMHFDGQALGTGFGELRVYGINEGQVGMLKEIELGPETTFDFGNYNGDGAAELRVQIPRTYNFGCAWIQTNLYEWHSHEPYDFQNPYPPNTPLCNAAKFIEGGHLFGLDLEQSSEMVVQAISPDIAPSEDYLALLQIRLAMDYAGKLEDDKAQEILDHLITYQHSTFAFLASQVWSESGRALLPFCTGLVEAFNAGEMDRTDLAPYFSSAALLQAYGNVYASAAPFICAPGEVLFSRLLAEQIATGENPVQYLLDRNYPLLDATAINLDDDPEEEWIAGLTIQNPKLLVFDARPDAWSVLNPYDFSDPIQTLMYRVEDLPGYGALDLIVLATFAPSVPVSKFPQCEGASLISELDIFELKWLPLNLVEVSVLCDVSHPLSTLTPEEIIALIPAPAQVVTTPDDEQFFFFDLERFEQDIFREGDIPADRDGLQNLLAAVPPDHPTAPHLIPRLLFDLGLSYELEGDAVAARVAYLELIAQWPDSPWAWLAEARVGP